MARFSRRLFLAATLASPLGIASCAHEAPRVRSALDAPPSVLFICQYGSVKSAVARELFRARAAARGIPVVARSRGITPAAHATPELLARLTSDGIDPERDPLTALDEKTLQEADIVVRFDDLPRDMRRWDARDWSALPSMNQSYEAARAYLDPRIEALLDEIERKKR